MLKSNFEDSNAIICVSMERVCILEPSMSEFATVSPFELEYPKGAALSLMNIKPTSSTVVAFFEASGVVRDSVPRPAHDVDDVSGATAFVAILVPRHTGPGSHMAYDESVWLTARAEREGRRINADGS